MINIWGPHAWYLIHTICEKIDAEYYMKNKQDCFNHLLLICKNVPCPVCRKHAVENLKKFSNGYIPSSKEELREFFFKFHNKVNVQTGKSVVSIEVLDRFKKFSIRKIIPYFSYTYGKQYYNRDDFSGYLRKDVIKKIIKWCKNIKLS